MFAYLSISGIANLLFSNFISLVCLLVPDKFTCAKTHVVSNQIVGEFLVPTITLASTQNINEQAGFHLNKSRSNEGW